MTSSYSETLMVNEKKAGRPQSREAAIDPDLAHDAEVTEPATYEGAVDPVDPPDEEKEGKPFRYTIAFLCVAWTAFQLYTAATGVLPALQYRSVHLAFGAVIAFLIFPAFPKRTRDRHRFTVEKVIMALVALAAIGYVIVNHFALWTTTSSVTTTQMVVGLVLIVVVLELARRSIGLAIPIIGVVFLIYSYVGESLPGVLGHGGFDLPQIAFYQGLSLQGIFGIPLGVIATFVFLFVLYAALLQVSGAGQIFIDIATGLFGMVRGGPAKVAVVASASFGTISGSAVANVASTGPFTIPLMQRIGYRARFAAAVEAVASSAGQITPPLMGASAFLIAEILAVPFWSVAVAAAVPAFLYFAAVFITVDIEAAKHHLTGMPREELPSVRKAVKRGWHLLLSPALLGVLLIVYQLSPARSAFYTICLTLVLAMIHPSTRMNPAELVNVAVVGCKSVLEVTIATASVGMVIGVMTQTGLGFTLSGLLIDAAGGYLIVLLVLTMLTSLVLGMGLPTVAAYLVLSVTVAPALIEFGVNELGAHLFIFYFGILSAITPPVALASMVAAGIAKSPLWPTSLTAFRLAIPAFILPFMFVYNPSLLLQQDSILRIVVGVVSALAGVYGVAAGLQLFIFRRMNPVLAVLSVITGCVLIAPGLYTAAIGFGVLGAIFAYQRFGGSRGKEQGARVGDSSTAPAGATATDQPAGRQ
ncbi:TRAP transporter permease [Blastococcus saxobsidens]|uniref:TRAP transporter, 4TM/12TM fusion protein n=1 Tax=Blastococcus saxobsidens (strain DD2) TaxID=1146883 RepID=H6RT02_BLASD|nr:TRAP transporter permease [Blastococcus saxobsidens]CCG04305.1 TRAP transporter, 4TM/12TM fusion protein [Blastococcus saxobsidens DD2]